MSEQNRVIALEMVDSLVNLAARRVERAAERDPVNAEKLLTFPNDLRTLMQAVHALNEPETKQFLLILTASFATAKPEIMLICKQLLHDMSRMLMKAVALSEKVELECDGCDEAEACERANLAATECVGKA